MSAANECGEIKRPSANNQSVSDITKKQSRCACRGKANKSVRSACDVGCAEQRRRRYFLVTRRDTRRTFVHGVNGVAYHLELPVAPVDSRLPEARLDGHARQSSVAIRGCKLRRILLQEAQ
eukprot:scaffold16227_cov30-Prasinocladus_malaysianus.AAC.1